MTEPDDNPSDDPRVDLAGLTVTSFSEAGLIERLVSLAGRAGGIGQPGASPATVCYVNAHLFNLAWCDAAFRADLSRATLLWPDGVSGRAICRLAGVPAPQRLSGFYFFDRFNRRLADRGLRQFLLGGRPETVERVAARLRARFGQSLVAGWHDGFFAGCPGCPAAPGDDEVIARINASGADVLTVGMGSPRQERWIVRNAARLRPGLLWTVGALFDFVAGVERAAPRWMRSAGVEWLYRLGQDFRGKWRRYLVGNPLFILRLIRHPPRRVPGRPSKNLPQTPLP